jgi:large subunit ribosomal protein L2
MSQVKLYKPTTPARRHTSVIDYKNILTTNEPYKKLTLRKKNSAGRSRGKITVRHIGGGYKKLVRIIDYKRSFPLGFKVQTIEYDPNRTAFICLVSCLKTGSKKYVIHTKGMVVGGVYQENNNLEDGNKVFLGDVPVGTQVSQIELNPNGGSKIVRSAGSYAIVTAKEDKYVTLKLPSKEVRKFLSTCSCVIAKVGNDAHGLVRIGKAGRVRNSGIRPTVRGKVMNPVDHPHGGGEARNSIGMKYAKTPWGKHAHGVKTRDKNKSSSKFIVNRKNGRKY